MTQPQNISRPVSTSIARLRMCEGVGQGRSSLPYVSHTLAQVLANSMLPPTLVVVAVQSKRRQRTPRANVPGGLLTVAQAATKLSCSVKTLNGHVASGDLKYVTIGHGVKRPRKLFTDADLDEFIEAQTRKDTPCPLPVSRARRSGTSILKCEVIDFAGPRKPPTGATRKK